MTWSPVTGMTIVTIAPDHGFDSFSTIPGKRRDLLVRFLKGNGKPGF
jgi:hypothetical protein